MIRYEDLSEIDAEIQLLLKGRSKKQLKEIGDTSEHLAKLLSSSPYPPTAIYKTLLILDAITNSADYLNAK